MSRVWSDPIPLRPARAPPDDAFAIDEPAPDDLVQMELAFEPELRDDEHAHDPLLDGEDPTDGFDFP